MVWTMRLWTLNATLNSKCESELCWIWSLFRTLSLWKKETLKEEKNNQNSTNNFVPIFPSNGPNGMPLHCHHRHIAHAHCEEVSRFAPRSVYHSIIMISRMTSFQVDKTFDGRRSSTETIWHIFVSILLKRRWQLWQIKSICVKDIFTQSSWKWPYSVNGPVVSFEHAITADSCGRK